MFGGEHGTVALDHLEKLFVALKSFFHPSNHGRHSVSTHIWHDCQMEKSLFNSVSRGFYNFLLYILGCCTVLYFFRYFENVPKVGSFQLLCQVAVTRE